MLISPQQATTEARENRVDLDALVLVARDRSKSDGHKCVFRYVVAMLTETKVSPPHRGGAGNGDICG